MLGLLHSAVAGHEGGHLLDALQWEWGLAQRLHGDRHELHGIVVRRHTVGAERSAALAAVDDRPFTAPAYPDRHRLHDAAADLAGEGVIAGMGLVVAFFKGLPLVFAVHGVSS